METIKLITITAALILLIGCATVDLTKSYKGSPPVCEMHKVEMHPEFIQVYGEGIYVIEYIENAKKQFPNHGGHLLNSEKINVPYGRDVIDFVCPKCDDAYKEYWNNRKQK
jgi:hypothetical protein